MRRLLIGLCLIALFLEVSGLIFSRSNDNPNEAMLSLLEPPEYRIQNLNHNSYFLLLGFAASPNVDPIKVGMTIWLESEGAPAKTPFDYAKQYRSDLRVSGSVLDRFTDRRPLLTLAQVRRDAAWLRRNVTQASILADRYQRWLAMPFEDRGYGHVGVPRFAELYVAHRLYVGQGFARGLLRGLRRVEQELTVWRAILSEARTLPMKVMAASIVGEDAELLSDVLARPRVDRSTVIRVGLLAQPFLPGERSLRWPVRNEFVVGKDRSEQGLAAAFDAAPGEAAKHAAWLAVVAGLQKDAFKKVQRPLLTSVFGFHFSNQRELNMYAKYYKSVIEASDAGPDPLPTLRDVARSSTRTLSDTLLSPMNDEPAWELFAAYMLEIDARLRLAAVQSSLRKMRVVRGVPARIAALGTAYYDPFTGLPMIWNSTQGRLYSVGSDSLDDGGDPTFDIVVTLPRSMRGSG